MGLSNLGILHTIIGLIALIGATVSIIKKGKIDLGRLSGKIYFSFTLITSFTSLGLSSIKGVNPGHILAVLIVVLISTAYFLHSKKPGNNRLRYVENSLLSFSLFLSLIPTVNETLTRLPVDNPLASSPTDPLIAKILLLFFITFIVGSVFQIKVQRKINKIK